MEFNATFNNISIISWQEKNIYVTSSVVKIMVSLLDLSAADIVFETHSG
jgi:hypothetical protein